MDPAIDRCRELAADLDQAQGDLGVMRFERDQAEAEALILRTTLNIVLALQNDQPEQSQAIEAVVRELVEKIQQ